MDGTLPPGLRLFTHILSDPATIASQHDTISVDPRSLSERDIFIQVTSLQLSDTLPEGEYVVSVGAFVSDPENRLNVYDGDMPRGTRLFMYTITIVPEGEEG